MNRRVGILDLIFSFDNEHKNKTMFLSSLDVEGSHKKSVS